MTACGVRRTTMDWSQRVREGCPPARRPAADIGDVVDFYAPPQCFRLNLFGFLFCDMLFNVWLTEFLITAFTITDIYWYIMIIWLMIIYLYERLLTNNIYISYN